MFSSLSRLVSVLSADATVAVVVVELLRQTDRCELSITPSFNHSSSPGQGRPRDAVSVERR